MKHRCASSSVDHSKMHWIFLENSSYLLIFMLSCYRSLRPSSPKRCSRPHQLLLPISDKLVLLLFECFCYSSKFFDRKASILFSYFQVNDYFQILSSVLPWPGYPRMFFLCSLTIKVEQVELLLCFHNFCIFLLIKSCYLLSCFPILFIPIAFFPVFPSLI